MSPTERESKIKQFFDLAEELGMDLETDESSHDQVIIYTGCRFIMGGLEVEEIR